MNNIRGARLIPNNATYDELSSPVGILTIITSAKGLHAILWDNDNRNLGCLTRSKEDPLIIQTKKQLGDYFQGERKLFDLPLVLNGTNFQIQAWNQLIKIPYATTISYAKQAERIGNKNKARAVGVANGQNPISIVIPCHRVIGSNGHLVGFAGGLDKKSYLLNLEKSNHEYK